MRPVPCSASLTRPRVATADDRARDRGELEDPRVGQQPVRLRFGFGQAGRRPRTSTPPADAPRRPRKTHACSSPSTNRRSRISHRRTGCVRPTGSRPMIEPPTAVCVSGGAGRWPTISQAARRVRDRSGQLAGPLLRAHDLTHLDEDLSGAVVGGLADALVEVGGGLEDGLDQRSGRRTHDVEAHGVVLLAR